MPNDSALRISPMTVALVRAKTALAAPLGAMTLETAGLPLIGTVSPSVRRTAEAASAIVDPKRNDCDK